MSEDGVSLEEIEQLDNEKMEAAKASVNSQWQGTKIGFIDKTKFRTVYDPMYCEIWVDLAQRGHPLVEATTIMGVATSTVYEWRDRIDEFAVAFEIAANYRVAWMERRHREISAGIHKGNAGVVERYLARHANEEYGLDQAKIARTADFVEQLLSTIGSEPLDLANGADNEGEDE